MVIAASNMILDHLEAELFRVMIDELPANDPTRLSVIRPGKLQQDPTPGTGLNVLIFAVNETMPFQLHSDNVQDGLQSPVAEIGGGWFYKHPYELRFMLHFRGESDRTAARTKAQIVFARAKWALSKMQMPVHPVTGLSRDDFDEVIIELQISKGWLNESGGPQHFIWRGSLFFEFLTEQSSRHSDLLD
jgi:hypothetical protein